MIVKFCVDSGANIHSCREQMIDLEKIYGITDNEWYSMSDEGRYKIIEQWADEKIEIYWEDV